MGKGTKIAGAVVGIFAVIAVVGYAYESTTGLNMITGEKKIYGVGADQQIAESAKFKIDIISCSEEGGGFITVKASLTNIDNRNHSPDMIIYASDSNNKIVTFEKHIERDVAPRQTVYIDRMMKSDQPITQCGIKIEKAN